jgi:hypothetical protein
MTAREVACLKRGISEPYGRCNKFKYDPLKRIPPRPAKLGRNYTEEDLSL